jgi:hypothetical protein
MIWFLQNWRLALLMAVAFAFGAMGIRAKWLSDRLDKAQAKNGAMKQELDAHGRMNDADLGIGASDDDVVKRLRDYAKRNGG